MPKLQRIKGFYTTGDMAVELAERHHKILYVINRHTPVIEPVGRLGKYRVYDDKAFAAVRAALKKIRETRGE